MDKFFYRLTFQPLLKGARISILAILLGGILCAALGAVSAGFAYWTQLIGVGGVGIIGAYFRVFLCRDYTKADTYANAVGNIWYRRAQRGKKTRRVFVGLFILPLLGIAVVLGGWFYLDHAGVLEEYYAFFEEMAASGTTPTMKACLLLYARHLPHFLKVLFTAVYFFQWRHVREFVSDSQCSCCGAVFALAYLSPGKTERENTSRVSRREKDVVVGARYRVTTEDGVEVSREKIADIYGKSYDYYRTDTQSVAYNANCRCAICKALVTKADVYCSSTTTKIN